MENRSPKDLPETRLSSPDQLNEYIRVARPSVWIVLGATAILIVCALIWGFNAKLDRVVNGSGFVQGGTAVICLSEDLVAQVSKGMRAKFSGEVSEGTVSYVSGEGISREEAVKRLGGNPAYAALLGDKSYVVLVDAEGIPDGVYDVSIVISAVRPLSFVLN